MALKTFTFPYRPPPGLRKAKEQKDTKLYPLLQIRLYSKDGKPICFEGLLDSGADGVFLPKRIAEVMDLPKKEKISTSGVLKSEECYKTEVGFIIGVTKSKSLDFGMIEAVFPKSESDIPILIGRDPIFKYFEVVFMEYLGKPKVKLIQKKPL